MSPLFLMKNRQRRRVPSARRGVFASRSTLRPAGSPSVRGSRGAARQRALRRGAAALDYILVLGIIFPLAAIVIPLGIRIVRAVYEMSTILIAWPFL